MTCGRPLQNATSLDDILMITGYVEPAMEGATVTFECPPQYVLIGPNTTTCMENGEWEPDPLEVECNGMPLQSTLQIISLISSYYIQYQRKLSREKTFTNFVV